MDSPDRMSQESSESTPSHLAYDGSMEYDALRRTEDGVFLRPRRFQFRSHVSLSNFGAPESGREPLARQRKTAALETGAMFLVLIEMKHERHNHFGTPGGFAGPVPRGGLDPRSPNRRRFLGRGGSGEGPDPPIHSPHGVRIFGGYQ